MKGFSITGAQTVEKVPIYWKNGGMRITLFHSLNSRIKKSWRLSKTTGNVKE